jgi:hypothetical protein
VKPSKPFFASVIDLGLRDIGVQSDPRRLARHFGKAFVPVVAMHVVFIAVTCAVLRQTGAVTLVIVVFALASTATVFVVALRSVKRSPGVVVKVTAEGTNQATWHLRATSVGVGTPPNAVAANHPLLALLVVGPVVPAH